MCIFSNEQKNGARARQEHTHTQKGNRDRVEDDRVIETDPRQKIQTKKKPTRDEESSGRQIDTEERDFDTKKQRETKRRQKETQSNLWQGNNKTSTLRQTETGESKQRE